MQQPLLECIPNFSEGRDPEKIQAIADAIRLVKGVKLLHVDVGKAANRTVMTFIGTPRAVVEAAFQAIKKAEEVIDMRTQEGEHPRIGATDVCPLVPVVGITMEEAVQYAHILGKRVGEELGISGYFYEEAATQEKRRNLAICRSGGYEGAAQKVQKDNWKPDFGEGFNAKTGLSIIGARDFLVAYNINLDTTSAEIAHEIAMDVRTKGRPKKDEKGDSLRDEKGNIIYEIGSLKHLKALGWYIQEYGKAQVSMNLTNFRATPMHIVFEEVKQKAVARGVKVTGSELIGLLPLLALKEAGRYFMHKEGKSIDVADTELVNCAIQSMGLDELAPFEARERVIEYLL